VLEAGPEFNCARSELTRSLGGSGKHGVMESRYPSSERRRKKIKLGAEVSMFPLLFVGSVGVVVAIAICWPTGLLFLGAAAAFAFMVAIPFRPELGVTAILIITSTIIFDKHVYLLRIPIGIGHVLIPDLVLAALLCAIIIVCLWQKERRLVRTPLDLPLLAFLCIGYLSTLIAIASSSLLFKEALDETRYFSYYLIFFIITNLVRDKKQIHFLVNSILVLGTLVAVAMIVQFGIGESVQILPGRLEALSTRGMVHHDIARIIPPGHSLVVLGFILMTVTLCVEKLRAISTLKLSQLAILGTGVVLIFYRHYWVMVVLVVFFLMFLLKGNERKKLIIGGMSIMIFGISLFIFVGLFAHDSKLGKVGKATCERMVTLFKSRTYESNDSTWRDRYVEYGYAFSQVGSHPTLGMGLGAKYRPLLPDVDYEGYDGRGWLHNGHLWILVKTGALGYISMVWLSVMFLSQGFRGWRHVADPKMRATVLAVTLTYLAIQIASIVEPLMMKAERRNGSLL